MSQKNRIHLQQAREHLNLSQEDVANRIGTTIRSISRWEHGDRTPSAYFRFQLCELYKRTPDELDLGLSEATHDDALYDPTTPLRPLVVGRERDLKQVKQHLIHGSNIALHGLPGIGKTTLATALTYDQDIRHTFPDGVLWAGLGLAPNTATILSHWRKLLHQSQNGTVEYDNTGQASSVRQQIGESCYLVILDDVWRLEDALALKVGGPNCVHLLTTRFPTIAMQFAAPTALLLQELTEEDGVELLQRLAPRVVEKEPQRVTDLVRAVGGLPLALHVMGNYLRVQSHSNQQRRIRAALERLAEGEQRLHLEEVQAPTETHTSLPSGATLSLSSVISVTMQRITERARTALSALSLLPTKPQHFSEDVALYIARCTTRELDELTDAGLLLAYEEEYTLHPVIADYAREHPCDPNVYARYQLYIQKRVS